MALDGRWKYVRVCEWVSSLEEVTFRWDLSGQAGVPEPKKSPPPWGLEQVRRIHYNGCDEGERAPQPKRTNPRYTRYKSKKSDSSRRNWETFWNGWRLGFTAVDRRLVLGRWREQVQSLRSCGSNRPRVPWIVSWYLPPSGCAFSWRQ